jgi:hypothetical protein
MESTLFDVDDFGFDASIDVEDFSLDAVMKVELRASPLNLAERREFKCSFDRNGASRTGDRIQEKLKASRSHSKLLIYISGKWSEK